jgi:hypothetical protein
MATCINLRERFGNTYRVTHEESYAAERPQFRSEEEPWLQIIPGVRGHVFPWSADRLAASTNTRGPVVKELEQHQRQVLLAFGPTAQIGGSLGSGRGPGELRITVDDVQLGRGPDFATALRSAQRRAAELAETPTSAAG